MPKPTNTLMPEGVNRAVIFYSNISGIEASRLWKKEGCRLPPPLQARIMSFRRWEDRLLSLVGKLLLKEALHFYDLADAYSLFDLEYTTHGRPYFNGNLDFNISHAGLFALCGTTMGSKVGLDIELIKKRDLDNFKEQFVPCEWEWMHQTEDRMGRFCQAWTRKEAFVKAIGKGLSMPLSGINVMKEKILFDGKIWYCQDLPLHPHYHAAIVSNEPLEEIILRPVIFP